MKEETLLSNDPCGKFNFMLGVLENEIFARLWRFLFVLISEKPFRASLQSFVDFQTSSHALMCRNKVVSLQANAVRTNQLLHMHHLIQLLLLLSIAKAKCFSRICLCVCEWVEGLFTEIITFCRAHYLLFIIPKRIFHRVLVRIGKDLLLHRVEFRLNGKNGIATQLSLLWLTAIYRVSLPFTVLDIRDKKPAKVGKLDFFCVYWNWMAISLLRHLIWCIWFMEKWN